MITTDIYWPESLPRPLLSSKTTQHYQTTNATEMESGRTRVRRVRSGVPSKMQGTWTFKGNQAAAFEAWYRDVLLDGAQYFNAVFSTPIGRDTPVICRFIGMYSGPDETLGPNLWTVNAQLEIYERPLLPIGDGFEPDYIVDAEILDLALNQDWPKA